MSAKRREKRWTAQEVVALLQAGDDSSYSKRKKPDDVATSTELSGKSSATKTPLLQIMEFALISAPAMIKIQLKKRAYSRATLDYGNIMVE